MMKTKLLTTSELAQRLGVSARTARRYALRDGCPHTMGEAYGWTRFEPDTFRRWARKRRYVLDACSDAGRDWIGGGA